MWPAAVAERNRKVIFPRGEGGREKRRSFVLRLRKTEKTRDKVRNVVNTDGLADTSLSRLL